MRSAAGLPYVAELASRLLREPAKCDLLDPQLKGGVGRLGADGFRVARTLASESRLPHGATA